MSDAVTITGAASDHIESLIADMLAANAADNSILLGTVISGNDEIQIQLVVTRDPAKFMDEA